MAGGTQNTGSMELARPARRIRDEVRMPHAGSHLRRHFDETFQAEHEAPASSEEASEESEAAGEEVSSPDVNASGEGESP